MHAQKPPRVVPPPKVSLCEHESLRGAVSVVIPCHNEEMNVGPLVDRLRDLFDEYIHEIIPVDDNSRDGTRRGHRASWRPQDPRIKPVFRTPPNGVGRAIADGYRAATGEWVLSMDCDFQHLLPEMRDLFDAAAHGLRRRRRQPVLAAQRAAELPVPEDRRQPGVPRAGAGGRCWRRFRDLTNNLKLIRRDVRASKLTLTQPGFAVNAETGLPAAGDGLHGRGRCRSRGSTARRTWAFVVQAGDASAAGTGGCCGTCGCGRWAWGRTATSPDSASGATPGAIRARSRNRREATA